MKAANVLLAVLLVGGCAGEGNVCDAAWEHVTACGIGVPHPGECTPTKAKLAADVLANTCEQFTARGAFSDDDDCDGWALFKPWCWFDGNPTDDHPDDSDWLWDDDCDDGDCDDDDDDDWCDYHDCDDDDDDWCDYHDCDEDDDDDEWGDCAGHEGVCQSTSNYCDGYYHSGLCPGPSSIKCCVPWDSDDDEDDEDDDGGDLDFFDYCDEDDDDCPDGTSCHDGRCRGHEGHWCDTDNQCISYDCDDGHCE